LPHGKRIRIVLELDLEAMLPSVAVLVLLAEAQALALDTSGHVRRTQEAQAFASDESGHFRRSRVPVGEHVARVLEVFPAPENCGVLHGSKKRVSLVCGGIPRYPPTLVSMSQEKKTEYRKDMCSTNNSIEFAQEDLTVTVTKVSGGETCVYIPSSRVGNSMHREVWNSTHTMLLGDWNGKDFMSSQSRERAAKNNRAHLDIDENLMIVPFAHSNSVYMHALLDFLPHAYATIDWVKAKDLKILTGSSLQRRLLLATGLDRDFIASPVASEDQLLCVRKGRSIHVMETNLKDSHEYYYHRILNHRGIGQRVAAAMVSADAVSRLRGSPRSPTVVFLGRCNATARPMDNEDYAFKMVRSRMQAKGRKEELVRFCGDAMQLDVQAAVLSRATAIIGPHGGAMANLLYAAPGCSTHVIEFVQSTPFVSATEAPQGGYKSFFYRGMGAPFDYKLVLMDKSDANDRLNVRLADLATALDQIW
jgi:capsular polysaccharide biosynthesis protein